MTFLVKKTIWVRTTQQFQRSNLSCLAGRGVFPCLMKAMIKPLLKNLFLDWKLLGKVSDHSNFSPLQRNIHWTNSIEIQRWHGTQVALIFGGWHLQRNWMTEISLSKTHSWHHFTINSIVFPSVSIMGFWETPSSILFSNPFIATLMLWERIQNIGVNFYQYADDSLINSLC